MQILLVRLRLIGDVVFTTPAIRAVRRRFPDARLTYLVEDAAAPVVAGNPHLDDVVIARKSQGIARVADDWRLGRTLARRGFDIAIDFHGGGPRRRSCRAARMWLAGVGGPSFFNGTAAVADDGLALRQTRNDARADFGRVAASRSNYVLGIGYPDSVARRRATALKCGENQAFGAVSVMALAVK